MLVAEAAADEAEVVGEQEDVEDREFGLDWQGEIEGVSIDKESDGEDGDFDDEPKFFHWSPFCLFASACWMYWIAQFNAPSSANLNPLIFTAFDARRVR